jgi:hypothetical protein
MNLVGLSAERMTVPEFKRSPQQQWMGLTGSRPKVGVNAPAGSLRGFGVSVRAEKLRRQVRPPLPLMVSGITRHVFVQRAPNALAASGARHCRAERCSGVESLSGFGQCTNRGVEAVPAAPVGFVVGFGGQGPDQLLKVSPEALIALAMLALGGHRPTLPDRTKHPRISQ